MKPILFNTEMVQAILENRKTVTRRIIKGLPQDAKRIGWLTDSGNDKSYGVAAFDINGSRKYFKLPYLIGDILYVRETWSTHYTAESDAELEYCYKADGIDLKAECLPGENNRWYPSIHMPKEAARIFLRVTDVKIERLQDITTDQAIKEGAWTTGNACPFSIKHALHETARTHAIAAFAYLWDPLIKKSELSIYGWDANPYVWVYYFEVISKAEAMEESEEEWNLK